MVIYHNLKQNNVQSTLYQYIKLNIQHLQRNVQESRSKMICGLTSNMLQPKAHAII